MLAAVIAMVDASEGKAMGWFLAGLWEFCVGAHGAVLEMWDIDAVPDCVAGTPTMESERLFRPGHGDTRKGSQGLRGVGTAVLQTGSTYISLQGLNNNQVCVNGWEELVRGS